MANGRGNILQRIVRLVWDRNAARKAEGDSKRAVSGMDKALAGLKKAAVGVGAAFSAAFAFTKIMDGIRAVTRAAIESERIWNRLSGTLRTVGVDYNDVEGQIQAVARAMQDTTTVGDEEFAEVLQQLVIISGDYEQSLRNVAVVADVAAGAQIDLSTAADLVGRAMVGETGTLKRYGIIVEEGTDAVEHMREQFRGLAENESPTLGGRLDMLGNEVGDLKEEIGLFIAESKVAAGTIEFLTGVIKGAAEAIRRLRETDAETAGRLAASAVREMSPDELVAEQRRLFSEINRLRAREQQLLPFGDTQALRNVQRELSVVAAQYAEIVRHEATLQQLPGLTVTAEQAKDRAEADQKAVEELEKARQKEIQLLLEAAEARALTADEEARIAQLYQQSHAELVLTNTTLERRLQLMKELAALGGALGDLAARRSPPTPGLSDSMQEQDAGIIGLPPADLARFDEHQARHQQWAEALIDDLQRIQQQQMQTWAIASNAVGNFFEAAVSGSEGIGEAFARNLLAGLAGYLDVLAAAEFAKALIPSPTSGNHIAAGIALKAAAGIVRGFESRLRGPSSGGGASVSAGGGGAGASRSQLTQLPPDITIVLQGDFDALNPKFVRAIHTATNEGVETIGPGRVRLQTVGGR